MRFETVVVSVAILNLLTLGIYVVNSEGWMRWIGLFILVSGSVLFGFMWQSVRAYSNGRRGPRNDQESDLQEENLQGDGSSFPDVGPGRWERYFLRKHFYAFRRAATGPLLDTLPLQFYSEGGSPRMYHRFSPPEMPPADDITELMPLDALEYLEFLNSNPSPDSQNIFYWVKRLKAEVLKTDLPTKFGEGSFTTYGFFETGRYGSSDPDRVFGATVFIKSGIQAFIDFARSFWNIEIPEYLGSGRVVTIVKAGKYRFPLFFAEHEEIAHCGFPQPSRGTTTCKAATKAPGRVMSGFLTAKHVAGNSVGAVVPLECGHTGFVANAGEGGIDAAFIVCSSCTVTVGRSLDAKMHIAPWIDVAICTKSSGRIGAKVTAVSDTGGIYNHHQLPVRVLLSRHGSPGDSGALVVDEQTGEAVGIYVAAYMDQAGRAGGIAQGAFQVTEIMKLNLYE